MTKQTMTAQLTDCYTSFVRYIENLTTEEYTAVIPGKWTAEQQLEHIILCVKPLVKVFGMGKSAVAQTFGTSDRQSRSYDVLLSDYLAKLNEGGKAPERFVPASTPASEKEAQCQTFTTLIETLCSEVDTFSETELDSLLIPHPLLGNLTLREMLYNAIYHVQHHQSQIRENLKTIIAS